jgi:signal transduction histidine kinase
MALTLVHTRSDAGGPRAQARQVGLVRLLLLALACGVMVIVLEGRKPEQVEPAASYLRELLTVVAVVACGIFATLRLVRWRWQLALHLVFDLVWTGLLLHFSGGVASPGVVLLFVIVLVGTLVLPGVAPFVLPALGSLVLAVVASLWLAGHVPFPYSYIQLNPALTNTDHIVGILATQVAALFMVDLLGQLLAKRLHEQHFFTGELLDQLGEGVLAVDRSNNIVYANAEVVRLLRLGGPVQGLQASQVLSDDSLQPVLGLLVGSRCPVVERFVDSGNRQLVVRVSELVDRRQHAIGRTLLIADETRLKLLEDSAHRAQHLSALGEMAAGIAHEVRNPLTSLRGCAQELAELSAEAHQKDAESLANILLSEADRLARIVEDFLALSRLRSPQREPVELGRLIDEVRQLVTQRRDLPDGMSLTVQVEPNCPEVLADPGQIRQVLNNLIGNSIDALRQQTMPRLSIDVRVAGESNPLNCPATEVLVVDNGCGIPPENLERVFTPFFSTKSQGTGLGLSLVQRIIREHEGVLQLDSAQGKGTKVTIFLPIHSQTRTFKRALGGI